MEYILSLVTVVLLSEMLLALMPDSSIKRYCRLAAGVLMATLLLLPLRGCLQEDALTIPEFVEQKAAQTEKSYEEFILDAYYAYTENTNELRGTDE